MRQRQIWILAAAVFTCLCTIGLAVGIARDRQVTRALIGRDTEARVDQVAAYAEQGLGNAVLAMRRAAEVLADVDPSAVTDVVPYRTRLDDLVTGNPAVGTLWATGPDGITWLNNNSNVRPDFDNRDAPYFRAARAHPDRLFVGEPELGTVRKRMRIPLAAAIAAPDGSFRGAVVAGIDQSFFQTVFNRVTRESAVSVLALDEGGGLLASQPAPPAGMLALARNLAAEAEDGERRESGGWLFAVRRLDGVPVVLVAATDLWPAFAEWRARSLQTALIGLVAVIGFVLLTIQGVRAVGREETAVESLRRANETLEARVRERTRTVELLFRELNHRVKNNLQIIASLLRLQIRKSADPQVRATLQDSVNRVFAIADVHGELEGARDGSVGLRSYVGKIVSRICEAMRKPDQTIDVDLSVDDAELPLDRAVLVAIAINETVTNAFKHAFAGRDRGRLAIAVRMGERALELTVANDVTDGDRPDGDTGSTGLGASIVEMLVQQLAGTLVIERSTEYTVRITVPLTEAVAA